MVRQFLLWSVQLQPKQEARYCLPGQVYILRQLVPRAVLVRSVQETHVWRAIGTCLAPRAIGDDLLAHALTSECGR
jgi:hypothetical protein